MKNIIYKTYKLFNSTYQNSRSLSKKYQFESRVNNNSDACIILAGYKEFLWDSVFSRIKKFLPKNIDLIIVSPGIYSKKLSEIAKKNGWSYLSVSKNNLCLAQNIAFSLLDKADYLYKLDEDMFITENFFSVMKKTYQVAQDESRYEVGFVAPLIPINGYGYIRLLDIFQKFKDFESKFGPAKFTAGNSDISNFTKNPEVPSFFWEEIEEFKLIDRTSKYLGEMEFSYSICPIRFSIGAIYFKRSLWQEMGMFRVGVGNGLSFDEIQLCNYCNETSRAIIVSENNMVGHLCYGPQAPYMIEIFKSHKDTLFTV